MYFITDPIIWHSQQAPYKENLKAYRRIQRQNYAFFESFLQLPKLVLTKIFTYLPYEDVTTFKEVFDPEGDFAKTNRNQVRIAQIYQMIISNDVWGSIASQLTIAPFQEHMPHDYVHNYVTDFIDTYRQSPNTPLMPLRDSIELRQARDRLEFCAGIKKRCAPAAVDSTIVAEAQFASLENVNRVAETFRLWMVNSPNSLVQITEWITYKPQMHFPPEVSLLTALKTIAIFGTEFSRGLLLDLPDSLSSLKLTKLQVPKNYLKELPSTFSSLTSLEHLDLSDNHLTEFPEAVTNLSELRSLNISYNLIDVLPITFTRLTSLTTFSLSANPISSFPEGMFNLVRLKWLYIESADLAEFPRAVLEAKNLEILDLGSNQLCSIPGDITALSNLNTLRLQRNAISVIPSEVGNLTRLYELNLSANRLTSLPDSMENLVHLRILYLSSNNFQSTPTPLPKLTLATLDL